MAPIYDTDVAEERWSHDEWRTFELWERIEQKAKRKRNYWIFATILLFVVLSAAPVFMDRLIKWRALAHARKIATIINSMKRDASLLHLAHRIRFEADGNQRVWARVERGQSLLCGDPHFELIRREELWVGLRGESFQILSPASAKELDVPGLIDGFCYSPTEGGQGWVEAQDVAAGMNLDAQLSAIGVISVKDLSNQRIDRLSLVFIRGKSAEISFD